MDEVKETGKWYRDVPYEECKRYISARLKTMTCDFIAIGYYLKYIRDKKLYEAAIMSRIPVAKNARSLVDMLAPGQSVRI